MHITSVLRYDKSHNYGFFNIKKLLDIIYKIISIEKWFRNYNNKVKEIKCNQLVIIRHNLKFFMYNSPKFKKV